MIGVNGNADSARVAETHVCEVVASAERELRQLLRQRAEIMKRIGTIKQTLAGLANLFGDSVLSDDLLALLDRGAAKRRSGLTLCARQVTKPYIAEAKGRFSAIGFTIAAFDDWRQQFDRIRVVARNGSPRSTKGYIVATRFATEANSAHLRTTWAFGAQQQPPHAPLRDMPHFPRRCGQRRRRQLASMSV